MPDRGKVVNALECCIDGMLCAECGYEGLDRCFDKVLLADALALLKEQEAMNVDTFMQWCIDSHIMGDATIRGIEYWVGKFKEGR